MAEYIVKHYKSIGKIAFQKYSEALEYCKKQAPLIGLNYLNFSISGQDCSWELSFKRIGNKWKQSYCEKIEKTTNAAEHEKPITLIYNGSEQDIFYDSQRQSCVEKIKDVLEKGIARGVILKKDSEMFRATLVDDNKLHYQPVEYKNGAYINVD